jgi:hypothetical protein
MSITIGDTEWVSDGDCQNADHTALVVDMEAGVPVPMSVTNGVWCGTAVWVDLDNDLSFDDSERLYSQYTGGAPSYTYNFTITIPGGTPAGNYRMRVISPWGSDGVVSGNGTGPCGAYQYGNYDDFTVNVTAFTGVQETNATPLVLAPNPTTGRFSIRAAAPIQRITVSGVDGRIVSDQLGLNTTLAVLDLSHRSAGLYTVRCDLANGTQVLRVVKD